MVRSRLGFQTWLVATHLLLTSRNGTSSMELHRRLSVTRKTAWFLSHRIRRAFESDGAMFSGPIEVDESFLGGKFKNKHAKRRRAMRKRPDGGKTIVAGAKDRATKRVRARVVKHADQITLHDFISRHAAFSATIYTDEAKAYQNLFYPHQTVNHSAGEYVCGDAHTNGIESFWATFKRAVHGTYHKLSPKHMNRYLEFTGRLALRDQDPWTQFETLATGLEGKRLPYAALVADNHRPSGAHPAKPRPPFVLHAIHYYRKPIVLE